MNVKRSFTTKVIHKSTDGQFPDCNLSLKGKMPPFEPTEQPVTCLKCQGSK